MTTHHQLLAHLADYKRERLGVQKNGVWIGRYGPVEKAHILPKEKYKLNLLDDVREAFFDSEQGEVPLHRYFHHLNSSQAMCINLFFRWCNASGCGLSCGTLGCQPLKILRGHLRKSPCVSR